MQLCVIAKKVCRTTKCITINNDVLTNNKIYKTVLLIVFCAERKLRKNVACFQLICLKPNMPKYKIIGNAKRNFEVIFS